MLRRIVLSLFACLPRFIVAAACCLAPAHAADSPGLLDSLGKLLAPAPAASVPTAASRTLGVAATGQGRRIALVIGNADYQHPDHLPKLANPANDAEDIAAALRGFGFEVIERKNQTLEAMNQTIADFGSRIGGSEAALFYFAGHGIQVKNQNYLMPVNARIDSEASVPYQGVDVNRILDEMDNARSSANIVMLDACRNNPISGKFRSGKSRGLAAPGSSPKGTVIVYATDPGNTAADGEGRNGLFTSGLLTAFKGKDLSLDDVLTVASAEVERISEQKQTPYVNGPKTLQKNFHFRVAADPGRGEAEKTFWTGIERSTDPADFEAYLRKYPNGSYRALAENQIKQLKTAPAAAAKPPAAAVSPAPSFSAPAKAEDSETQFWNEVKTSGAREYLDAYLKQYPKGKYLALAKIELKKLDERDKAERARAEAEKQQAAERERQEALRNEQAAWDQAKAGASAAAYAGYLERYPAGRYAALAQAARQKLQRETAEREQQEAAAAERAETDLWRQAEATKDRAALQRYVDRYPNGRHVADARAALKTLAPPAMAMLTPTSPPAGGAGRHVGVTAPEIAENGEVVPVDVTFSPPLKASEKAVVRVAGNQAAELNVLVGEVSAWSLRVAMPSSGTVTAHADRAGMAEALVKITAGADIARIAAGEPVDVRLAKVRTTTGLTRILVPGRLTRGKLLISGQGFRASLTGSPYLSRNPVFSFKGGSLRDGDTLTLSLDN